jgi:hypothetical protein
MLRLTFHYDQTYHGKIRALLFATGAMTVHVVDIPLWDGVSQLSQISHLQILHCVDQLGSDKHVLMTGRFRKTYNTNADTLCGEGSTTLWTVP